MEVMYDSMHTKIRSLDDNTEQIIQEIASRVSKSIRNRRNTSKTDTNIKATIKERLKDRANRLAASMLKYKRAISTNSSPEENVETVDDQKRMERKDVMYSLDENVETSIYKKSIQPSEDDLKCSGECVQCKSNSSRTKCCLGLIHENQECVCVQHREKTATNNITFGGSTGSSSGL